jgi:hypothetical protein
MNEMMKKAAVVLPAAMAVLALWSGAHVSARGEDLLAKFNGGIATSPVGSLVGVNPDGSFQNVTQNIVRGVKPAGGAWRIADLKAEVDANGHITVKGRGLVLAGGDRIGQSLQLAVGATLICGAAAPFAEHATATLTKLDLNGDFRIDDDLLPVPTECASPVLLIRSNGNGVWLAAGVPDLREE